MEFINDFLSFICYFALGYLLTRYLVKRLHTYLLSKIEDPERDALVAKVMEMLHRVKKETHGDINYWFDEDTDMFLGQGRTEDEIKEQLKKRFKGHIFIVDDKHALAGPDLKLTPLNELARKDHQIIG